MAELHTPSDVRYSFSLRTPETPLPAAVDLRPDARRLGSRSGIACLSLLLLQAVLVGVIVIAFPNLILQDGLFLVVNEITIALASLIMVFQLRKFPSAQIKPREKPGMTLIPWSFACLAATQLTAVVTRLVKLGITGALGTEMTDSVSEMLGTSGGIWGMLSLVVLAPIIEELIFRELFYRKLIHLGDRTYILFSAVLFGLFHANFDQVFYAFAVGVILGHLRVRYGRWQYCAICHGIVNLFGGGLYLVLASETAVMALSAWTWIFTLFGLVYLIIKRRDWFPGLRYEKDQVRLRWLLFNGGMYGFTIFALLVGIASFT